MDRSNREGMDSGYMGMIKDDRSSFANMPEKVVMKEYPKSKYFRGRGLDDTITGIDDTIDNTAEKMSSHQSDSMY